jgi:MFS family permease
MLAWTVNSVIVLVSLPAIFRGIKLDPLVATNVSYLLWMVLGYLVGPAVLAVTIGRLGGSYGRVRIYNLGFAIFGLSALALPLDPFTGPAGAQWLIGWRVLQGIGSAMLMANHSAILTDAFPADQRGRAVGLGSLAGPVGTFTGLVAGGALAAVNWRLVFIVLAPVGLGGAVWAYLGLREISIRTRVAIDWRGNITFGLGLIGLLVAIVYGVQPYGGHPMGWTSPVVLTGLIAGGVLLVAFCFIEMRVGNPMLLLPMLRIRSLAAGIVAALLASIGRGGLLFLLIIWLEGIWLILRGHGLADIPLWAGLCLLPTAAGVLVGSMLNGLLPFRLQRRWAACGWLLVSAAALVGLALIATDFAYLAFGVLTFLVSVGTGGFAGPSAAAVMGSVPARRTGAASDLLATVQNSGFVLSIGLFFALVVAGLSGTLPTAMIRGLTAQGVPAGVAHQVAQTPASASLFSTFLGANPVKELLAPTGVLNHLPAANVAVLTSRQFFPDLISGPFGHGRLIAFSVAAIMLVIAAGLSLLRGPWGTVFEGKL